MNSYWKQKASTWVSLAVLAGGLVSACLLVFVYNVEKNFEASADEVDLNSYLEEKGY
jgi:flagellar basal body-associated protein FliL